MSVSSAESASFPERLQIVSTELVPVALSDQNASSQDLLLAGIKKALGLPEAVTVAMVNDPTEQERFIQLTNGEWSLRVEATERNPARVSRYVNRQDMHVYAYHYGVRLLLEASIGPPPQNGAPIDESWGAWGVLRPLAVSFTDAWKERFSFLIPSSTEMRGEDNLRAFSEGPDREKIRLGITSLLASAHPDTDLTNASRDYWLAEGYAVVLPDPSRPVPEIE